jgi:hypothetical protein
LVSEINEVKIFRINLKNSDEAGRGVPEGRDGEAEREEEEVPLGVGRAEVV